MNSHFLVNACKVLLTYICDLNDFASVDLLGRINSRPDCLLLRTVDILQEIGCKLCFAYFTILPLAKYVIHEYNEIIDFTHLGLF